MIGYFDSSVLLAILLDEKNQKNASDLWTSADLRVSSILLRIETTIVVRRTYSHFKAKLGSDWLTQKLGELEEYLKEVNYRIVDAEIEKSISLKKDFARCRALDAIHIATALEFNTIKGNHEFKIFSYDSRMLDLAKQFRMATNVGEIG